MFEPRPEISTAIRLRSAMVRCGPGFARAPGLDAAAYGAAGLASLDPADPMDGFAGRFEPLVDLRDLGLPDNRHHADPAIEGSCQLARLDRAARLEEGEQAGQGPAVGLDDGVRALGQDPRDVFEQAAAGDMRKRADLPLSHQREETFHIDAGRFEKDIAE